jgi:chitinase
MRPKSLFHLTLALITGAFLVSAQDGDEGGQKKWINGYYPQWKVYSNFYPKLLVTSGTAARLNSVTYAFAVIRADAKDKPRCATADEYADYQYLFTVNTSVNHANDAPPPELAGNFHQLQELKERYPNLKVVISIGGGSAPTAAFTAAADAKNRSAFVRSCIEGFIEGNFGITTGLKPIWEPTASEQPPIKITRVPGIFDGIDIDWEWPTAAQKEEYVAFLEEFRRQLDKVWPGLILSAALPPGEQNFSLMDLPGIARRVNYINLENYDYNGPWENSTGFVAPLYQTQYDPNPTLNVNYTVQAYLGAGVPPEKILLGIPFYSYGWTVIASERALAQNGQYVPATPLPAQPNTPPPNAPYNTEEYNYVVTNLLPIYEMFRDPITKTPWLFDPVNTLNFFTYDDAESIHQKMQYAKANQLRGAAIWELTGDLPDGELVKAVFYGLRER